MRTIIAILLVFSLALTACGGADTTGTETADDAEDGSMLDALDEAGIEIDPVLREFMELEEKRAKQTYMVAYTATMSGEGETLEMSTAEFHQTDERVRRDTTIPELGESRTYELGERYITCSKFNKSWRCEEMTLSDSDVEIEEIEDDGVPSTEVYDEGKVDEATVTRDGTVEVAGQTAQCYRLTIGEFSGRECRNKQGVMLLTEGEGIEIRATQYSGSVSASDFELPATPMEAGSPEAQQANCLDVCVKMALSDNCEETCRPRSAADYLPEDYASGTYPEGTSGDWSDTDWENYE